MKVKELKEFLQERLDKLKDLDENKEVKIQYNTYWCGPIFLSMGNKGFVDLEQFDNDEEEF